MRYVLIVGLVLVGAASILSIISAAIPYWVVQKTGTESGYFGLWTWCIKINSNTECSSFAKCELTDWFKGVQAMAVLGLLCLCCSTVAVGVLVRLSTKRIIAIVSIILAILGGICCLISVIVFGVKEKVYKSYFGAGFYLNIVAAIFAFASAITVLLSQRDASGYTSF